MININDIMSKLQRKLEATKAPIRSAYLDNIQQIINNTYISHPPVTNTEGEVLNKVSPQEIPSAIIRSDDGFKLNDGLPDHQQTLGMMEIYGNHPQSMIRAYLYSNEFRNRTISDAITRARREIL